MTNWLNTEIHRKYHEICALFPLLEGESFRALVTDIAGNGLLEPIWLHPDGSIIDGRNRHRACIEAEVQPRFHTWDGGGSLVALVISLNLHRRHLISSQRAAVAVEMLPLLEAEAKERYRATVGRPSKSSQRIDTISAGEKAAPPNKPPRWRRPTASMSVMPRSSRKKHQTYLSKSG